MVSSSATTVAQYLASLPADRRKAIAAVRKVIKANLPPGFKEGMQFGMIGYFVPLSRFPDTYNGQPLCLAALASQKNHLSLYLMSVYGDSKLSRWFTEAHRAAGKKVDMGKSCIRFREADDLELDVVGDAIGRVGVDDWIAVHERAHAPRRRRSRSGSGSRSQELKSGRAASRKRA